MSAPAVNVNALANTLPVNAIDESTGPAPSKVVRSLTKQVVNHFGDAVKNFDPNTAGTQVRKFLEKLGATEEQSTAVMQRLTDMAKKATDGTGKARKVTDGTGKARKATGDNDEIKKAISDLEKQSADQDKLVAAQMKYKINKTIRDFMLQNL